MNRKRILIDMDSTIVDLLTPWLAEANRVFGDELTVAHIKTWAMHPYSKGGKKIYGLINQPGFFSALRPLAGALDAVKLLVERGHEVYVVTAAEYAINYTEKVQWAAEHMPWLRPNFFALLRDKHLIPADALVDDGPHNAEAYKKAHPQAQVLTIGYPYNFECPHYDLIAGDWRDTSAAWVQILDALW